MNIATIKKFDIANGPGVRVSIFVSGCTHACKNCFNKEARYFNYGVKNSMAFDCLEGYVEGRLHNVTKIE